MRAYKYYKAQGFPRKEPRKEPKKNLPQPEVSILELYPSIDVCPEELRGEDLELVFSSLSNAG